MSDTLPPPPSPDPAVTPSDPSFVVGEAGLREPPRAGKRRRIVALVVAIALIVVAGGASAAVFAMRGAGEELMGQVPADADIVVSVYLDPAASQKLNLVRIAGRFPGAGSESELLNGWNELLDQGLASSGLNHNDLDWVGAQVAFQVNLRPAGIPSAAILLAADDVEGAERMLATLRERNPSATWHETDYKGVTVSSSGDAGGTVFGTTAAYAIVGDTVVFGSSTQAVDEVIDADQGAASMQDSADFQATMQGLPEGRLLMTYVRPQELLDAIRQQLPIGEGLPGASFQTIGASSLDAERGLGMTLSAEGDGLAMDINVAYDSAKLTDEVRAQMDAPATANTLTSMVPADAYGVVFQEHVDDAMRGAIAQLGTGAPDVAAELTKAGVTGPDGLLGSLTGEMVLELLPGSDGMAVNGALVVGSTDGAKMQATLDRLRSFAVTSGSATCSVSRSGISRCHAAPPPDWVTQEYEGTTITYQPRPEAGDPEPAYAVIEGAGILATSVASVEAVIDARSSGNDITTAPAYRDAMAKLPTEAGVMFLDVRGVLAGFASALPADAQASLDALRPVSAVVVGADTDASHRHVRILIEIP